MARREQDLVTTAATVAAKAEFAKARARLCQRLDDYYQVLRFSVDAGNWTDPEDEHVEGIVRRFNEVLGRIRELNVAQNSVVDGKDDL